MGNLDSESGISPDVQLFIQVFERMVQNGQISHKDGRYLLSVCQVILHKNLQGEQDLGNSNVVHLNSVKMAQRSD